ncbi:hypothetical protein F4808DRAFT_470933 [Astrocystis sublimbata]|nr:hypothetical protein F4808DRAFT_470933 [Astrocystis sublimbata]
MPYDAIFRDGFSSAFGCFYAEPEGVQQMAGSSLRNDFLPKMTLEGKQYICNQFVRGQLKHYGVAYQENEISGRGTCLLKKVLQAVKCDRVPSHISKLRAEMHEEWLAQLTPEELSNYPKCIMESYFLTGGKPHRAKTREVIGIALDVHSRYRVSQICRAANSVAGLHQQTGRGPKTHTIFMGWNSTAVSKAAEGHAAKETEAAKATEEERFKERAEAHSDYLKAMGWTKGSPMHSPIGRYMIDCEYIERGWDHQAEGMSLDISATDEPGIFVASFDFGFAEGVMMMRIDREKLEMYCIQLDIDANNSGDEHTDDTDDYNDYDTDTDYGSDYDSDYDDYDTDSTDNTDYKKETRTGSRDFYIKLKFVETVQGEIIPWSEDGTITFKDGNMVEFCGMANFTSVGYDVQFTGQKVSDDVVGQAKSWSDYSTSAYDMIPYRRWHC